MEFTIRDSKEISHGVGRSSQATNTLARKSIKKGKTWISSGPQSPSNEGVFFQSNLVPITLRVSSIADSVFFLHVAKS
jgi:hypothetical protein